MTPIFTIFAARDFRHADRLLGAALHEVKAVDAGAALVADDQLAQGLALFVKALVQVPVLGALDEFERLIRGDGRSVYVSVDERLGAV